MSERNPRFAGGSDLDKMIATKFIKEKYASPETVKGEREKTPEELVIIQLVEEEVDKLVVEYGGEPVKISPAHIHVIQADMGGQDRERWNGHMNPIEQSVVIHERASLLSFAHTLAHEMLHFKSFQQLGTMPVGPDQSGMRIVRKTSEGEVVADFLLRDRRVGLAAVKSDTHQFFGAFNEAMTEWMAMSVFKSVKKNALFASGRERTAAAIKALDLPHWQAREVVFMDNIDGETQGEVFTYRKERWALGMLIEKIAKHNPDFASPSEVQEQFAKLYFTGKAGTFLQVIDKTFGPGTLRKIAAHDLDGEALLAFVKELE